jgi:hypothetical protein
MKSNVLRSFSGSLPESRSSRIFGGGYGRQGPFVPSALQAAAFRCGPTSVQIGDGSIGLAPVPSSAALFAAWSTASLPGMPLCAGIYRSSTSIPRAVTFRKSRRSF